MLVTRNYQKSGKSYKFGEKITTERWAIIPKFVTVAKGPIFRKKYSTVLLIRCILRGYFNL